MDGKIKALIAVLALVVLFPFILPLLPKAFTVERFLEALEENGLTPRQIQRQSPGGLESVEQTSITVEGARVEVYRYDAEGKIAKHLEYQRPDAGTAIVETWNLGQTLGAAQPQTIPSDAVRRGKHMLVVTGHDDALRTRIVRLFRSS